MVMKKVDFYMQFANPPDVDLEKCGGEKLVESAGYVSAEEQILSMLNAGMRLDEARREAYDTDSDIDGDIDFDSVPFDPTRMPAFDPADASAIARVVNARLAEQAKAKPEIKEDPPKEE